VSGVGTCLVARAERERGERARLRAQVSRGKVGEWGTRSKGARTCGGGPRMRGRGRVHGEGRGREVRDGLTGGVRGTERERARVREKRRRQVGPTEQREGERKRRGAQVGADRRGPPVRDRRRALGAGPGGPTGPNWLFHFLGNF
jgi:hypothetical protein